MIKELLISEREFSKIKYERSKTALVKKQFNMCQTVGSLKEINNITDSNNITLRKVKVNPMDLIKCIYTKIK